MGYYSGLDFYNNAEFKDIEKLNKEISKLSWGSAGLTVQSDGELESEDGDGFYGKFYDDREFAELLSKYIVTGDYALQYRGEDGECWGYLITSNEVIETEMLYVPVNIIKKVKEFIDQQRSVL